MLELAIFYCQHQTGRIMKILEALDGPAGPNIRKVALPCSGKLETSFLLKALENGAHGVALFGCPEGECRYLVGSTRAKNRVGYVRRILREIGLEEDRVHRFVLENQTQLEETDWLTAWAEKVQSMSNLREDSKIKIEK
jgi:coenzyme F420-reducing hydrogenase delta subunit